MMRAHALFLLVALAIGCQEAKPSYVTVAEPSNTPGNERVFVEYVLQHLSPTMEGVTCHCCRKSLKQCLGEMGKQVQGACPFT